MTQRRIHFFRSLLLVLSITNLSFSQNAFIISPAKYNYSANHDTLPYRLVYPQQKDSSKKYPLLIYLHGMGTRGRDNEMPLQKFSAFFADSTPLAKHPCYILVPQCPQNDVWVSFPHFPNSLSATNKPTPAAENLLSLIYQLINTKNIDPGRIYLTGYSMGGEGTFDLAAREPGLLACAVPLASVADTSNAGKLKEIPFWVFHGTEDRVNPFKYSKLIVDAMKTQGSRPIFTKVKNTGHDCRDAAYLNPEMWDWMFKQEKKVNTK